MGTFKDIFFKLFVVVFCFSTLSNYGSQGRGISKSNEDVELERQLKILNKPPKKTFHTEWGDIVDCVDIHKQPAFDHPSLKNHKIEMRPASSPKRTMAEKTSKPIDDSKHSNIRNDGIECPEGTVPIKRTTKEDLIRAKSFSKTTNFDNVIKQEVYAHARLESFDEGIRYFGAKAGIYTYNPSVGEDQFSGAQIWIESGVSSYEFNTIQAGWIVAPQLYKDHRTRLFTYWVGNGTFVTGCYNTLCPGFVQVDRTFYPGSPMTNISTYGGPQFYAPIYVYQDKTNGDWWLIYGDYIKIGYWPKALFIGLQNGATMLRWGGSASVSEDGMSPAMGSGRFPDGQPNHSCYLIHVMYIDDHGELVNLGNADYIKESNCPNFYGVGVYGYVQDLGTVLEVGGPGGKCRVR